MLGALAISISLLIFVLLPGSQTGDPELWEVRWRVTFIAALGYLLGGLFLVAVGIAARQAALLPVDIPDV